MLYCKYAGVMCNLVDSNDGQCVAPKCIREEKLNHINKNVDEYYFYKEDEEE